MSASIRATGRSWLRITADGRTVYEGTAPPGWEATYDAASSLRMLIGNAAGIVVSVQGRPVGSFGAAGEVWDVRITLRDGIPVVRKTRAR